MQPGAYETYRSVRVFSALDGLRAIAVLAVVWHHAAHDPTLLRVFPAARFGFLGVDLFFEISGFLIVTLLLRERDGSGRISLGNFYARRTLRIFPLYYGLLAAASLLYFFVRREGGGAEAFRSELWVMALYLSNWIPVSGMFAVTWSLAAEEQFYLVWPPIEKWLSRYAVTLVLVAIVLSQIVHFGVADGVLEAWFGWSAEEPAFLRQTTWTPICLGVLLAHALHERSTYDKIHAWFGRRAAAPLALAVLVGL
jgi:peptidoglycan/LPS O-acetylase OafA/YrhL